MQIALMKSYTVVSCARLAYFKVNSLFDLLITIVSLATSSKTVDKAQYFMRIDYNIRINTFLCSTAPKDDYYLLDVCHTELNQELTASEFDWEALHK